MSKNINFIEHKILISFILAFITGCQNTPVNNSSNTTNKPVGIVSPVSTLSSSPVSIEPATIIDEKSIQDLITNSPELFPVNLNTDSEELKATVPNNGGVVFATVPNNGGVVFVTDEPFAIKDIKDILSPSAIPSPSIESRLENIKSELIERAKERLNKIKASLPTLIGKKQIGEPKKEVKIDFNRNKTSANVTIKMTYKYEISTKRGNAPVIKKIQEEESIRKTFFVKEGNKWVVGNFSPVEMNSQNSGKLSIESIKLKIQSSENTDKNAVKIVELDLSGNRTQDQIPVISRKDIITLEIKAINKDTKNEFDPPVHIFLRIPQTQFRIPLFDDASLKNINPNSGQTGFSGDLTENDDIYTGSIMFKNKTGIQYLTIDVIDSASFEGDLSNYLSISKSLPIRLK